MAGGQRIAISLTAAPERQLLVECLQGSGFAPVDLVPADPYPAPSPLEPAPDAIVCDSGTAAVLRPLVLSLKVSDPAFLPTLVVLEPEEPEGPWLADGFDYFLRRPLDLELARTLLDALLAVRERSRGWAQTEEARFRTLFDATGTATIVVEADNTISMANRECARVTGYTPEELIGTPWTSYVAPESLAMMRAYHEARRQQAAATGESATPPAQYETRLINKAGEVRDVVLHVRTTPAHGQSVVSMLDVTEYRRATAELEARERLFRSLFDEHAAVKLLIDPQTLQIVDANHAAADFYGWSRDDLIGMPIDGISVSPPEIVQQAREAMLSGSRQGYELTHRKADGTECSVEVFGSPIETRGQTLLYAIIHDISERKRAEAQKLELERQLAQSTKMEAIGRLAGGIAHDLNNMLTTVIGCSELILADETSCTETARRDVEAILEAANRAASLTGQILAFARQQSLRPQVFSLNQVMHHLRPLLSRMLGEDVEVIISARAEPDLVEADVHQIEQVIMNLAVNARDAMPRGGRLVLGTSVVELTPAYCQAHPDATPGVYVVLSVSDTGVGMDEYTRSRIFEPFFTTKPPGQGTGLGLSTVYGIVRQSGGSITVYSEPGRGTSFKIYLPQARTDAATDSPGPAYQPVSTSRPEQEVGPPAHVTSPAYQTILVVEDEPALRTLITRVLHSAGYNVVTAVKAEEALTLATKSAPAPHLLLTDVILPGGLRGDELAARLEFIWPGLPVIYMSGYARDHLTTGGRLTPGIEYLEKPFTPEALTATVRRVLDAHNPTT